MTWNSPISWPAGLLVTESIANAQWRDNLLHLKGRTDAHDAEKGILLPLGRPGGGVIATGLKQHFYLRAARSVTGWTLVASEPTSGGSIVIDLRLASYSSYNPGTPAPGPSDSICGSEKPTLSSGYKAQDLALTSWDPIPAGSVVAVVVESSTGVVLVSLSLDLSLT